MNQPPITIAENNTKIALMLLEYKNIFFILITPRCIITQFILLNILCTISEQKKTILFS